MSCLVGQGTLGLDNFPLKCTVPRRRTMLLDSDGPAERVPVSGRDKVSRVMPSGHQLPVSQFGDY